MQVAQELKFHLLTPCSLASSQCASHNTHLRAVDLHRCATLALVALNSDDLVVVLTERHALAGPGIEVGLHVDRTAGALVLANGPVLLKGLCAVDGGLVGASALGNLVRGAVGGDGTLVLRLRGRVVRAEVLDDVVLDQRVAGPAVDGKVGVAAGVVCAGVGDGAGGMLVVDVQVGLVGRFQDT
jgi:hypothetical protein